MIKRDMGDLKKTQIKSLDMKNILDEISVRLDAAGEKISKSEGNKGNSPK